MALINCKVESKLQSTKYYVAAVDNTNNLNSNNIIFTIKDTKVYDPVVTLSALPKTIKTS